MQLISRQSKETEINQFIYAKQLGERTAGSKT